MTAADSDKDCQRVVRERCNAHEVRMSNTGECGDPAAFDCSKQCPLDGGGGVDETGR